MWRDMLVSKSGFEPRGTESRRSTTPSHGNMRLRLSSTETLKRVLVVPPTKIRIWNLNTYGIFNDIFQSKINALHLSKFLRSISWEPSVMIGWASQMDARETLCCHMFLQSKKKRRELSILIDTKLPQAPMPRYSNPVSKNERLEFFPKKCSFLHVSSLTSSSMKKREDMQ